MKKKKQNNIDVYYFSDRLLDRLAGMERCPLTIVEAPSGFGKTTAVREYLNGNIPRDARQFWYVCMGEPREKAWDSICALFDKVDAATAQELRKLGIPAEETITELTSILRELDCRNETFFVIDNYQIMESGIPRNIINAFSMHGNDNLHIIFIMQTLQGRQKNYTYHSNIHTVGSTELVFDRESTAEYFRMIGIRLKSSELDSLCSNAEGWVAAIRLQLLNYQQTGKFENTTDIYQLVRMAVWNRLSDEAGQYLLSLSLLDGFTAKQARIMLGGKDMSGEITNLLDDNAFIRYSPEKGIYVMHGILQNFLRERFESIESKDKYNAALRLAGESCAAIHDYFPAMKFFYRVGDFDSILSLPMQEQYINYQKERHIIEWVVRVVKECPSETLRKYPKSITMFAFEMFFFGQYEIFGYLCELIGGMLANSDELSEDTRRTLAGEMEFIKSFMAYNDIEKMSAYHQAAYTLLGGPSWYMFVDSPWTFGAVSVMYMFWSKTGELARELSRIDECLPYYTKLARGHGTGADAVMRAEILFAQGNDADAETLCHKAIYLARSKHQISICLCAELILARIAILRGDSDAYSLAVDNIRQYAERESDWQTDRMVDLCETALSLMLGGTDIPEWLSDMDVTGKNLFAAALPYCHILYGRWLLNNKQYSKLYGVTGIHMSEAEKMNYILPRVYHLIHLAAGRLEQGRTAGAQEALNLALALALPDGIYMPFAEYGAAILPLFESAKLSVSDRDGVNSAIELTRRQDAGMRAVSKIIDAIKSPLTPREREIALLAKNRLSAKEIADKLFISESTVRGALKIIYSKLEIHSKSELADISL